MKFTQTDHDIDWEAFFENATEDISNFDYSMTKLENAHFSTESGHWFVSCLSRRSRGIQALGIIQKNNPPNEYFVYRNKLRLLMEATDSRLNRLLDDHSESIVSLFLREGDLWGQVDHLERQLQTLRRAFQNRLLFQEETDPPEETLRDLMADFLLPFAEFYRAAEDAPPSFKEQVAFQSWRSRFSKLDSQFQTWFGYLQPVADMLTRLQQREYYADFWWLIREPVLDDVQELELSDAWLQSAGQAVFAPPSETCPDSGLVISYAFHELTGQERREIQNHVRFCSFCLNLVLDLRAAQDEARQDKLQTLLSPEVVLRTGAEESDAPSPVSKVMVLVDKLKSLGESLVMDLSMMVFTPVLARSADENMEQRQVGNGAQLSTNDQIQLSFKSSEDVYGYLLYQNSLGKIYKYFESKLNAGQSYHFPEGDAKACLTGQPGKEIFYLVTSKTPLDNFDAKMLSITSHGSFTSEELRNEISNVFPGIVVTSINYTFK